MNSGMVRYTEVQLYIDFTLTVPTSNPTRPYRVGEGKRENLGTRPRSQRLFVRGTCLQKSDTEVSRRTREKALGYPVEYPIQLSRVFYVELYKAK